MYNPQTISERIRHMCVERGVSVARMLAECGVGKNTIVRLDAGNDMTLSTAYKIAEYLVCPMDYLLGRTDSAERYPAELSERERKLVEQYRAKEDVRGAVEKLLDVK